MRAIACCCALFLLVMTAAARAVAPPSPSRATAATSSHLRRAGVQHRRAAHRARAGARISRPHAQRADVLMANASSDAVLFGDQALEPTLDSNAPGSAEAFPVYNGTTGTASSITVYVDSRSQASGLVAGLYSDDNGHPGSLLDSALDPSPTAGAWNTVSGILVPVAQGTTYWIAVLGTGGTLYFRDRSNGPCMSETSYQSSLSALPSSWKTASQWNTCAISAYASGTSGSAVLAPVNNTAPEVSGGTVVGDTLTTTNGSWADAPTSYAYRWQDCNSSGGNCSDIGGATSSTYVITDADLGSTLRARVIASNAAGSAFALSAPTAVVTDTSSAVPANTALPIISGSAVQGQRLTTSNGEWTNTPTGYVYVWQACDASGGHCANISGATSGSYTLGVGDVDHIVRVLVTASNAAGVSAAAAAPAVGPVTPSSPLATGCFSSPGACGFPDPAYGNVGASSPCSSYPTSNGITTSSDGQVIQNRTFTGQILVENSNVTIKNVCVLMNGQGQWSTAINVQRGTNVTIADTTVAV